MAFFKKCNTKEELMTKLAEVSEEIKKEYNDKLGEIELNAEPETPPETEPETPPETEPETPPETEPVEDPKPKRLTRAEKRKARRDGRKKKDVEADEGEE